MKLGFGPKYFLKCVLTDSVNNSILKKFDFGLNGPDRVTYTADGEYKDRWVAMSPNNNPSNTSGDTWLLGLTIDRNNQLLVGQVHSPMYISKHRENGSHIASFRINIEPYYLAATSHDTIVISDWHGTVQIVDSTSDVLHTFNTNRQVPFWDPMGVVCHNDIIMVCNSDRSSHEISCFSLSTGAYLGSIPVRDRPYGATIAQNSSKLLVGCFIGSVLVYRNKALSL